MIVESSKTKALIDKEDIINYEVSVLEQQIPQVKPVLSHNNKYSEWDLARKIRQVVG